jgi:hypothetical protein
MLLATPVGGVAAGVVAQGLQKNEEFCVKEEVVHRERRLRGLFCRLFLGVVKKAKSCWCYVPKYHQK